MTREHRTIKDPVAVLASLTPRQFRTMMATQAGATPAQLAALGTIEQPLQTGFPSYQGCPDGSIQATYTPAPGLTLTATVQPNVELVNQP